METVACSASLPFGFQEFSILVGLFRVGLVHAGPKVVPYSNIKGGTFLELALGRLMWCVPGNSLSRLKSSHRVLKLAPTSGSTQILKNSLFRNAP